MNVKRTEDVLKLLLGTRKISTILLYLQKFTGRPESNNGYIQKP
jgi:hypothetical protein